MCPIVAGAAAAAGAVVGGGGVAGAVSSSTSSSTSEAFLAGLFLGFALTLESFTLSFGLLEALATTGSRAFTFAAIVALEATSAAFLLGPLAGASASAATSAEALTLLEALVAVAPVGLVSDPAADGGASASIFSPTGLK